MEYTTIIYEKKDSIGTITLNRPKSMNALNGDVLRELDDVLDVIGVVPVASLMEETRKMASKIARQPGVALRITKLVINGDMNLDMKSALAYEARSFEFLFSTEDQKEGTKAFVEKRKPVFKDK